MQPAYAAALARLEKKAAAHVFKQANGLRNDWVRALSTPGQGRQYGKHRASAPGDAPAVNTGLLRGAIAVAKLGALSYGTGVVSVPYPEGGATTSEVAVYLEYGTKDIAPRPHARPALDTFKARHGL